ncbi:HK97 family phage prohead protease [Enterococcus cecorum]|uniref:HK97 family phage prohead protease n=1 Tax=Enterococcus cecorum TaxID=44008 RepID=A0AAW8TQS7_9ENTE|nr:HK97 family phage prohead protease [Enterococcus cecorum]MDT2797413.1 HK97 family phage prohead protease [Enterococcus cecorum]
MKKYQTRSLSGLQTREAENDQMIIGGYFVVFNTWTELWDGYYEQVSPKAFENVDLTDIRALINHNDGLVLGRTKSNTLTLRVDDKGLYGEIKVNPNDQDAVNLYERVKRGDVDQCSFGFQITEEEWEDTVEGYRSTITGINLFEVSVVTFPAYEDTSVSARSKDVLNFRKRKLKERLSDVKANFISKKNQSL